MPDGAVYPSPMGLSTFCRDKLATDTSGFLCVDSRKTQLRGGRAAGAPRAAAGIAAGIAAQACLACFAGARNHTYAPLSGTVWAQFFLFDGHQ